MIREAGAWPLVDKELKHFECAPLRGFFLAIVGLGSLCAHESFSLCGWCLSRQVTPCAPSLFIVGASVHRLRQVLDTTYKHCMFRSVSAVCQSSQESGSLCMGYRAILTDCDSSLAETL